MSVEDDLKDISQTATRLVEAGHVFSRASNRALELLGKITTFRDTVEKTMPVGQSVLERENTEWVLIMLNDTKFSKLFNDPAGMLQERKYVEFARSITQQSMINASSLVSAAALVFAHSVFDATLSDYCRATALSSWRDWIECVEERKVSIRELQQLTRQETTINSITKFLEQLEKESILKKADMLHYIIKPGDYRTTVLQYSYSRERLEEIDRARHEAVHKLQFREGFADIDRTIDYLRRTVVYFMGLLNFRYKLQIDTSIRD